jgi:HSP20 family protein
MSSPNNPFDMFERMFDQMSRQFQHAARSMEGQQLGGMSGPMAVGQMGIDLADQGEEFIVTADVPGFQKEDISLWLDNDVLQIQAQQQQASEESEEMYLRSERRQRMMSESIRIPGPVKEDEIEATLKNGVLTVKLPKMQPTQGEGHQIDIQ